MEEVYRAKGFFPIRAEETFPVDSKSMLKNFTKFSDGIKDVRVAKDGSVKFRVDKDKAILFWGNIDNTQPLEERINLWTDSHNILFKVKQSQERESKWSLSYWCEGKKEYLRKSRLKCTDIPLKGTNTVTLTFRRFARHYRRAPSPNGLYIVIQNAKGSEMEITSMQLVRNVYRGYFRKEFVLPKGKVWSAIATVGIENSLYVNGKEVVDETVRTTRPYKSRYSTGYLLRAVDLKPYLKPGANCIGLEGRKSNYRLHFYMQAKIIMEDGEVFDIDTDETWKWNTEADKGYSAIGFDDSKWRNVVAEESKKNLKVKTLKTYLDEGNSLKKTIGLIAYDGFMRLANPYERTLFYTDDKPVVVEVKIPSCFNKKQPVLEWEVKRFKKDSTKSMGADSQGKAIKFKLIDDSLVCKLDLGKYDRGVYTLELKLKSGDRLIEERIPEPFVVVGRIPMKEAAGDSYEQDMDLTLETKIDFTDPADPHPSLETDGVHRGAPSPLTKNPPKVKKEDIREPVIVEKNGLKYRETQPICYAQFSYKVEFKHPGDFYLMVLDYPDNQERWMGAACIARWKGLTPYSKIGPAVIAGWKYPVTHTMKELKWIYRPDPGTHVVNIVNLRNGMAAAAAGLRIYHIKGGLPALKGHQSGERFFGILTENTNPRNTFGWTFSITGSELLSKVTDYPSSRVYYKSTMVTVDTQPVMEFCKELSAWLDTSEAYTKYLRFTGQNLHAIGAYQYSDQQVGYTPCPSISTSRIMNDFRDVAVRVFRENGINFIATVEFMNQSALSASPEANKNNTQLVLGEDSLYLVDKDGNQLGNMNFLNPKVEDMLVRLAGEIAEKWKDQPNFLGESWMSFFGDFTVPTYIAKKDFLSASYDDATIKRFEKDTGIKVPGAADDPLRFSKRYEFLTGADMKERWVQWRCEKMRDFFIKIKESMQKQRKDLACYISLYISDSRAIEWKQSGLPLRDYLRNAGWDIELFKNIDDLWLVHWMYAHARYKGLYKRPRGRLGHEASFEMSVGKDFYDLFGSEKNRCQMNMHHWVEVEKVAFNMPWREDWVYPYQSTLQAQAGGYNANEVFTQGLIGGDPELVLFGFSHVSLMGGNEQPMREFARVLRALPGDKFSPVLDTGLRTNFAIRDLRKDGKYMFYVANPGYWPIKGHIVLENAGRIKDLVSGKDMPVKQDGGKAVLSVKLKPYGVQAFVADSPQAQVVSWRTEPVPEKELAHLRGLITKGETVLQDPAIRTLTSKEDLLFIQRVVDKANSALEYDKYARAWSDVTNWKYWGLLHESILNAENFDPWMAIGPSSSSDGTVQYPAGPAKEVGWQEIRVDEKSIPMVGYVYRKSVGNWTIGYAAIEVYSPKQQDVTMIMDAGKESRVWVNRGRIENVVKQASGSKTQYILDIPLNKGWNRIVSAVDAQHLNVDFGFALGKTDNLSKKPKGLKFRLPQTDLAGPRTSYRVNCGGSELYVDKEGKVWLADHDYNGWATERFGYGYLSGRPIQRLKREIAGTEDDMLYKRAHFAADEYRFLVVPGSYTVRLHFAETFRGGKGRRIFKVLIQDKERFTLDIFEEAGLNAALVKTIENVVVKDGELKIGFKGVSGPSVQEIAAIEIVKED